MAKRPAVLDSWDEVQHDPLSLPPDDFAGMSTADAVELIREWFFENFEDPAVGTPHDSGEGGYQYIWGGPYSGRDIIENVFADTASDELIQAAVDSIEADGVDWVPNGRRRQPPEEDEDDEPDQLDPAQLHAELLRRLDDIEELLAKLPETSPGIGHNRPPEPIEEAPLTPGELIELREAVAVLRAQPAAAPDDGKAAAAAAKKVTQSGRGLAAWLKRHGDTFASEAAKEGGKAFGKWGGTAIVGVLTLLATKLLEIEPLVTTWLHAQGLHLPF